MMETLEKKGPVKDLALYNLIRITHGEEGFGDLNKTLMRLEIQGKIYVSTSTRGKRRDELIDAEERQHTH